MRDVDERDPDLVLDSLQLELHVLAELQIERAERLVEQEHAWVIHECPRERDPLLLTPRELLRPPRCKSREPDELEDLAHPAGALALCNALALEPERDVVLDRHVRKERVALEDGVDVALVGRQADDVLLAEEDPALARLLEPADHAQRRRLPASGGAEQREEGPSWNLERDPVHGDGVVEALDDVLEPDVGSGRHLVRGLGRRHSASFTAMCLTLVYSSIE